jgi:hypothetical protein
VWIPTLATLGQGLFMPLSGYLEDRLGVRITILIGKYMGTKYLYKDTKP